MSLTQSKVTKLALPPGASDKIFYDDDVPGLGVRLRAGGSAKFVFYYRFASTQRRHTIGNVSAWSLEQARKTARALQVDVDEGRDPAAQKETQRTAAAQSFKSVADEFLAIRKPQMKPRSYAECHRHLVKQHWKAFHRLSLTSIGRAAVATRLREISKASGPVAADRARSTLSAMFAWAIGEGMCDANPVIGTNKASKDDERERVLSDAELAAVWKAAPDNDYGKIVRLLILTGQRRDEIGGLRKAEIDLDVALVKLPGERTKNKRTHEVPLSDAALNILRPLMTRDDRPFVFGRGAGGGYSGWSRSKEVLDTAAKLKEAWTLHDIRRTVRTGLGGLGIMPHVSEAILNHLPPKLVRTYDKNKYEAEKRAALVLWAEHVEKITGGKSNVIAIKGRA